MDSPASGSNDGHFDSEVTVGPACKVVRIQSLMCKNRLHQIGELIEAQLPWQRRFIRKVRDRILAA